MKSIHCMDQVPHAPTLPSWAAHTDWYDVITDTAPIQNHDISLSGGNDKARFFAGFGYFNQEGIIHHIRIRKDTADVSIRNGHS